jgi:hypothetical protein
VSKSIALPELSCWIRERLREDDRPTVVLAGHYAIFSAGGLAVDFMGNDDTPPAAASEMIAFTKYTWATACEALDGCGVPSAQLLVLVDDVAFVRPLAGDISVREKLGAALATRYLEGVTALPAYHTDMLVANHLDGDSVCKMRQDRWVFSERELRIAHVRRLRGLLHSGEAGNRLTASFDESEIRVHTEGHGDHCLVHSGRTNCAGGYLELLATLEERGVKRLIALVPMRCLAPIAGGTALAGDLFSLRGLSVLNVAVPDALSDAPVATVGNWTG